MFEKAGEDVYSITYEPKVGDRYSGSRSYVSSMSFLRGAVGWVVVRRDPTEPMNRAGYEGMVLKTNNAGQSWDEHRTWRAIQIYSVRFVSNEEGWLVGRNLENGGLFLSHTTEGGRIGLNSPQLR